MSLFFYSSYYATHYLPLIPNSLAIATANISYLVVISIHPLLYQVLVAIAGLLYEELKKRMEVMCSSKTYVDLEKWRRCYDMTCRFVEQINHCFSLILFIVVCQIFFMILKYTIVMIDPLKASLRTYSLVIVIRTVLRFLIFIFTTYRMQRKV